MLVTSYRGNAVSFFKVTNKIPPFGGMTSLSTCNESCFMIQYLCRRVFRRWGVRTSNFSVSAGTENTSNPGWLEGGEYIE